MKNALMLLSFIILMSLAGCGSDDNKKGNEPSPTLTFEASSSPEATATTAAFPSESLPKATVPPSEPLPETTTPSPEVSPEEEMKALILSHLDILAENEPDQLLDKGETIHNALFDEIVALGKDALPFLELIADRSYAGISGYEDPNGMYYQRKWAVHAIYEIKPEVYDLSFPSLDGRYTARIKVESFHSIFNYGPTFNDIQIVENSVNEVIHATKMENNVNFYGCFYTNLNWSADSRYAVIDCEGQRSGSVMAIDTYSKCDIHLPGAEEAVNHVFPGEDIYYFLVVPRVWFYFENWETDETVKIKYYIGVTENNGEKDFYGWYTYDLTKREIVEFEYSFND